MSEARYVLFATREPVDVTGYGWQPSGPSYVQAFRGQNHPPGTFAHPEEIIRKFDEMTQSGIFPEGESDGRTVH